MFWDILRKDLKRKKTINIVILLFIILAAMFVASGLNNVLTVVNGTDYYLNQADIGDYVVLTQQGDGGVPELLDTCQYVKDYRMDHIMYATKGNIKAEGKELDMANKAMIIESISESEIHFFTKDNKELTKVPEGEVYVTGNFLDANDLKEGDKLTITHGENSMELTIAGKAKDALLGSEFMGNKRFILNEADYQKFASDESLAEYRGEIIYIDTDNPSEIASLLSNASNILFNRGRGIFKLCYVMDMIVAFVVLVLSVCLMIVSFAVLKFTITFTVTEEYREIGVMKAIGITDFKIRSLYLVKYLMLAVVGAAIGFLASIPFGNMLLQSVTENMMLGNSHAITVNFMGAVIVIAVTIWFAYRCTGKVKKLTPVDAIRNGQSGERFKKKSIYRLGKSRFNSTWYLAVNDILSSPRRFLTIILSFFLCSVFMLGVVITTDTMKSKNLITTFGKESDWLKNYECSIPYLSSRNKRSSIYAHQIGFDFIKKDFYFYVGNRLIWLKDYYQSNSIQEYICERREKTPHFWEWNYVKECFSNCKKKFWKQGFANFDDLNFLAVRILKKNIGTEIAKRFPLILIDECQDLSGNELEVLRQIQEKGCCIHLIGDLHQSIYDFKRVYF